MENPYQSPETISQIGQTPVAGSREYEGIGRMTFVGIVFGIGFLQVTFSLVIVWLAFGSVAFKAMTAFFTLLLLFPVHARLKNTGSNPTWCFLLLVPMLNLLVLAGCLICPEGYADNKQLDTAGKVMTGLVVLYFLLMILVLFGAVAMGAVRG